VKISFRDGKRRIDIECTDGEQNAVQELMFGVTSGNFFASRPVPSRFGTPSGTLPSEFGTVGTLPSYPVGTPSVPIEAYTVPPTVPPSLPASRPRPARVRWAWIAILVGFSAGLCVWSVRRTPIGQSPPPTPPVKSTPKLTVPPPPPASFTPQFTVPKNVQP